MSEDKNKNKFLKGGLIGAVAGLVTGLLFAPKKGEQTRAEIKSLANKKATEAEKSLKKVLTQVDAKVDESKVKLKKARGTAKKEIADWLIKAEIAQKKLKETITAVREGEADKKTIKKAEQDAEKLISKIEEKLKSKK